MYSPCLVSVVHLANYIGFFCFVFFWGGGKVEVFCGLFQNNQLIFFFNREYWTPVVSSIQVQVMLRIVRKCKFL